MNIIVKALDESIKWCTSDPDADAWPNGPTRSEYVRGFLRPTGSRVDGITGLYELHKLFSACQIENVPESNLNGAAMPGCSYYHAELPAGYCAWEAIAVLDELTPEQLATVRVRRGSHGPELVSDAIRPTRTTHLCFIVDEDGKLVTWYPGRFTASMRLSAATVKLAGTS